MQKNKKTKFIYKTLFGFAIFLAILGGGVIYYYPYLPHAVNSTFLNGQTGPGIYDLEISPYNTIRPSSSSEIPIQLKSIDFSKIPGFITYNDSMGSVAFLVAKNDTLIFEYYNDEHSLDKVSNSFSMAKTVVGLLIGIAIEENKIASLDDPIILYLPDLNTNNASKVTIRHLLQMAGTSDWDESANNVFSDNAAAYYGKNLRGLLWTKGFSENPGKRFDYKSGETQFLTYILENVYNKSLSEIVEEKIWSPMEMSRAAFWSKDKHDGDEKGYCCLYATARDFMKLGSLFTHQGRFKELQIVPTWYIDEMKSSKAKDFRRSQNPNLLYGLHVWLYPRLKDPLIYLRGILGQYIIISPENNWVAVRLGHRRENAIETNHKDQIINDGHSKDFLEYVKFAEKIIQLSNP